MHSRKETVDRAITFGDPQRVPIVFWNREQTQGDVMLYHLSLGRPGDAPALREQQRMAAKPAFFAECGDRYRLASLDLSGFTVYTLLRGFENAMLDFVVSPDRFQPVMDRIMDFECRLIEMAARHGFHGIHFADDCGNFTPIIPDFHEIGVDVLNIAQPNGCAIYWPAAPAGSSAMSRSMDAWACRKKTTRPAARPFGNCDYANNNRREAS